MQWTTAKSWGCCVPTNKRQHSNMQLLSAPPSLVQVAHHLGTCCRGRQKDFIDTEKALGRSQPSDMSALVGYAGGTAAGPGGKVCYYCRSLLLLCRLPIAEYC
jgi:hypothetical protein